MAIRLEATKMTTRGSQLHIPCVNPLSEQSRGKLCAGSALRYERASKAKTVRSRALLRTLSRRRERARTRRMRAWERRRPPTSAGDRLHPVFLGPCWQPSSSSSSYQPSCSHLVLVANSITTRAHSTLRRAFKYRQRCYQKHPSFKTVLKSATSAQLYFPCAKGNRNRVRPPLPTARRRRSTTTLAARRRPARTTLRK